MKVDTGITINLKTELKKDFEKKVKESKYNSISEALNSLVIEFLEERKNDKQDIKNKETRKNGFYMNKQVKEAFNEYVKNTKEFTNSTDAISKIIYNYLYKEKYDF